MEINKTDPIDSLQSVSSSQKIQKKQAMKVSHAFQPDVVDLSNRAKNADSIAYTNAMNVIENTPDTRDKKIEQLQKNSDLYTKPSSEILDAVAQKLIKDFLG